MTALERAKAAAQEPKTCKDCPKSERFNGALYCTVNGKLIMPQFEDLCLCHGKLLEKRRADNEHS